MYILTFRDFVDIYSFQSLMEACNKNIVTLFNDKQSLKNGIISACPETERSMRAYKLSGELMNIDFDSVKPFKEFDHLIIDKNIIFNENCTNSNHYLYAKQRWFLEKIINFFVDEDNRNKFLSVIYFTESMNDFLENLGYKFISSYNNSYFIISESIDDVYSLSMYIQLNEIFISTPRVYSFNNYKIKCTTIDLE